MTPISEAANSKQGREAATPPNNPNKEGRPIAKTKAEIQRDYERRTNYAAQTKYKRANTKQIALLLNLNTDKDILQKLDTVPNKQGYIKSLIRTDIKKNKES